MSIENSIKSIGHASKNFVLGLGIFILTLFVVIYGVNTFYEKPDQDDFCGKNLYSIGDEIGCIEAGGIWTEEGDSTVVDGRVAVPVKENQCASPPGCWDEYDDAREVWSKKVFIVSIPLAILIIALGAFVFQLGPVGVGLMFGGVGTLIYGAGGYWQYSDNVVKFIISLIALVVLIYLAYYFNKKK